MMTMIGCSKENTSVKSTLNDGAKSSSCLKGYIQSSKLKVKDEKSLINDYIIPDSDKKLLTTEVLNNLDKSELDYARNEIYARHGYKFTIDKYQIYFSKKSWYTPNDSFSEKNFNETEQKNLKTIDEYVNSINKLVVEVVNNYGNYDLDGDGKSEKISLVFQENNTKFILYVNGYKIAQTGTNFKNTMYLYDIDVDDKLFEVAIVDDIGSNNYVTNFYHYDGVKISSVGNVSGSYDSIKVTGNSKLETRIPSKLLPDIKHTELYRLKNSKLVPEAVELYDLNVKVILNENITVQILKSNQDKTFELKKGEIVTLEKSDENQWISITNSEGKKGWLKMKEPNKINDKTVNEIFSAVPE